MFTSINTLCNNSTDLKNCKYILDKKMLGNSSVSMAFNNKQIYRYSNDWLYLIKHQEHPMFRAIEQAYVTNRYKEPTANVSGKCLLVSTVFSSGTVHGYAGIFDIIEQCISSNQEFDKYIVHRNAQTGIIDIIKCSLPTDKIYFIEEDTVYKIESLTLFPVTFHAFFYKDVRELNYLYTKICPLLDNIFFSKTDELDSKDICVLKSSESSNLTTVGVFHKSDIEIFCLLNNLLFIEPTDYSEDVYARIIYNSQTVVFSWGSTFLKGLLYISDICKRVIVLIHKEFLPQFNYYKDDVGYAFKNAIIEYRPVEDLSVVL